MAVGKSRFSNVSDIDYRWQTQGPRAESGPPPGFIQPSTLSLPGSSTELLAPR